MSTQQQGPKQQVQLPSRQAVPPRSGAQQQARQRGQQALHVQKDVQETEKTAPPKPYTDPLGRPLYQGNPRFTDQQVGGDLTGDEYDARDDNYAENGPGQHARDVSAHASRLPAASAELLRFIAVSPASGEREKTKAPATQPDLGPEPDGTEDPGSNADDGLDPRKLDGNASEPH